METKEIIENVYDVLNVQNKVKREITNQSIDTTIHIANKLSQNIKDTNTKIIIKTAVIPTVKEFIEVKQDIKTGKNNTKKDIVVSSFDILLNKCKEEFSKEELNKLENVNQLKETLKSVIRK